MILTCERCGITFRVPPCRARSARYCSAACRRNLVRRVCEVCGNSYEGHPNKRGARCCSKQCAGVLSRRRVYKTCEGCGRTMDLPPSHAATRRFCSRACRHEATRVRYACEICGCERVVNQHTTAKRFCSHDCRLVWFRQAFVGEASPHWRGGRLPYYGPTWRAARRAVRARDGACRHCGSPPRGEALSVAHVVPFRWFGLERHVEANALTNLLALCRSCHKRFDQPAAVRARMGELLALEVRQLSLEAA